MLVFLVPAETSVIDMGAIDIPPNSEKAELPTGAVQTWPVV